MRDCPSCKHRIFDEQWGEYKCKKQEKKVTPDRSKECRDYSRDLALKTRKSREQN